MNTVSQYLIQQTTIALLPFDAADGSLHSLVIEEDGRLCCSRSPLQIMQASCIYFGSTYSGRKRSAKDMGFKSMPPICVCNELGIFFFPVMAESRRDCAWMAHAHVLEWEDEDKRTVQVKLSNQQLLSVYGKATTFGNKVMRTAHYRLQLNGRIAGGRPVSPSAVYEDAQVCKLKLNAHGTYMMDDWESSGD
ncbi:MAG: competence protein ComK [Sporolactobacillus sp.]